VRPGDLGLRNGFGPPAVDVLCCAVQATLVFRHPLVILLLALPAGCGEDSGGSTRHDGAGCRGDNFSAGLKKSGKAGRVEVVLEAADPAPPAKGDNQWTIRVTDLEGTAVDDAKISVSPFMPEHGHGSSSQAQVTPKGEGRYELFPVNFVMPGMWEITIELGLASGQSDNVLYTFCVEG
jgi:hypothetical protein